MTRFSTGRWAGIAGLGFVVAYVGAFAMGIEVGPATARSSTTTPTPETARARWSRSS